MRRNQLVCPVTHELVTPCGVTSSCACSTRLVATSRVLRQRQRLVAAEARLAVCDAPGRACQAHAQPRDLLTHLTESEIQVACNLNTDCMSLGQAIRFQIACPCGMQSELPLGVQIAYATWAQQSELRFPAI
jgi:hypothetical protein